jgi:hypothetical protein
MPKLIQLATRIFRCLSSNERWERDAGGLFRTLKFRSFTVHQSDEIAPMAQTAIGKLMVIMSATT